jgi:hypothetical protein
LYYSHGPEFNTWYSAPARAKTRFVTVEMYCLATDESDLSSSNEFAELAPLHQATRNVRKVRGQHGCITPVDARSDRSGTLQFSLFVRA